MFIFSYITQKVKVHIWNEYPENLVLQKCNIVFTKQLCTTEFPFLAS